MCDVLFKMTFTVILVHYFSILCNYSVLHAIVIILHQRKPSACSPQTHATRGNVLRRSQNGHGKGACEYKKKNLVNLYPATLYSS